MIRERILFRLFFSLLLLLSFSPFCTYEPTSQIHPSTKAENEKLKKKNKTLSESLDEATHESVLKQLKDAKLQREYQEALEILECIPKEVLDAYAHRGTTERNHPMKQGL